MTKRKTRTATPTDKATVEAARLVARAYATLIKAGHKNAVDGLAVACTKAIQGERACMIPVTVKSLKMLPPNRNAPSKHKHRNIRAELISSIFDQRKNAAVALIDGIRIIDETVCPVFVSFKD